MASFVISTQTTAGQTLGATEFGLLSATGSILSPVGSAVTMTGSATLIAHGAIAATTATALRLTAVAATSVTIGQAGSVIAGGIDLPAISGTFLGNFVLSNAGQISGGQAISLAAAGAGAQINIGNDGMLQGLGNSAGAALSLALNQTSRAVITNTGTLSTAGTGATIAITGNGSVTLTNTGDLLNASVLEAAIQVEGALTLRNSGLIEGNVTASLSGNIFNSGTINGNIRLAANNDVVRVSGLVLGDVVLGNGTNVFWQTGGRVMGTVSGGAGADTYHVDRTDTVIVDTSGGYDWVIASCSFRLPGGLEKLNVVGAIGMLALGNGGDNWLIGDAGDDTLRGGWGNDSLEGGVGTNRLQGGMGNDSMRAGEGEDLMNGGAGDDVLYMGYGSDTLIGGNGRDTLRFDLIPSPTGVVANLSTMTIFFPDMGVITWQTIENLWGSAQNDMLTGDGFANVLTGAGGADVLVAGAGNDTLNGGVKGDTLDGGAGSDTFVYNALTDSNAAFGIDRINWFVPAEDVIDLRAIDPITGGTDDAFFYLGTAAFTGTRPELRWYNEAGNTIIELRRTGMVSDDMEIVLNGTLTLNWWNFTL